MSRKFKALLYIVLLLGATSFSVLGSLLFVKYIPDLSSAYILSGALGLMVGMSLTSMSISIFYLDETDDFEYPDDCYMPMNLVGIRERDNYVQKLSSTWKMLYPADESIQQVNTKESSLEKGI